MTPQETTDNINQLPDGPKAFYRKVDGRGIDIHVIYNFASHRVDAELSFSDDSEGLRDDYIENIVKQAAEHAVECINGFATLKAENDRLVQRLEQAEKVIEHYAIMYRRVFVGNNDQHGFSTALAYLSEGEKK